MTTLDPADRSFQKSLIRSMAKALASGLLERDDMEVQKWAARFDAIARVAENEYGPFVLRALMDQAWAESERVALSLAQERTL